MVTSIVLTGEHKIELDKHERFIVDGAKINIKEVPFVRYRFNEYTDTSISYIQKMQRLFKYSAHLAEVTAAEGAREIIDNLYNNIPKLIIYLYVEITDKEVKNGLDESQLTLISNCYNDSIVRVMLKDKSSSLYVIPANRIKKQLGVALGINPMEIGICSSPLSFNGEACLTAVRARQLAAIYSDNDEAALPSANHECMNSCGCIKYVVISSNIFASSIKVKSVNNKDDKNSTVKTTVKNKVGKNVIPPLRGFKG